MKWTAKEDSKLLSLIKGGATYSQIGNKLGRTGESVRKRYRRLLSSFAKEKNQVDVLSEGSIPDRVTSLEDIIHAFNIDSKIWDTSAVDISTWEQGAKIQGDLTITTLYRIKAALRRKELKKLSPHIVPIDIPNPPQYTPVRLSKTDKTVLIIPDIHFGFVKSPQGDLIPMHDERALSITLQLAKEIMPDEVIILGDLLDLAEASNRFVRKPEYYFLTQPAIIASAQFLVSLRKILPSASIKYIEGNHEKRITNVVIENMAFAYEVKDLDTDLRLFSIPNLLKLPKLGIEYISDYPNGEVYITPTVKAIHGTVAKGNPGDSAKKILQDGRTGISVCFGHTHRMESLSITHHHAGRQFQQFVMNPGCLCKIDGTVPGYNDFPAWTQGIGIIFVANGKAFQSIVPIQDGTAIYNGKVFRAE